MKIMIKILLFISVCFLTLHLNSAFPTKENSIQIKNQQVDLPPLQEPQDNSYPGSRPEESNEEEEVEPSGTSPEDEVLSDHGNEDGEEELQGPRTEEEEEEEEEAELNPNLFEGDLKLSEEQIKKLSDNAASKRDTMTDVAKKWPKAIVPFKIQKKFAKDKDRMKVLRGVLKEFKKKTCVRFVKKKKKHKDFVKFLIDTGCYSTSVGKNGGQQHISIGSGCNFPGTVMHEMMHAIGFFHEHTRHDRDQYVTVNWNNIEKGRQSQFKKYGHGEGDYLNEPYDYDSVMHYPRTGFGIKLMGSRLPTIVPKDKPWRTLGQRIGFSVIDLRQINKLYNCTKFTANY